MICWHHFFDFLLVFCVFPLKMKGGFLSVIFDKIVSTFEAILVSICHHFSEKKMYRKWLRKKGPLASKQDPMNMSGGSQRSRLACALLKQETTVRAQISNIAAGAHVLFSKCCLNSFKSTLLMIWHALGKGPANFYFFKCSLSRWFRFWPRQPLPWQSGPRFSDFPILLAPGG